MCTEVKGTGRPRLWGLGKRQGNPEGLWPGPKARQAKGCLSQGTQSCTSAWLGCRVQMGHDQARESEPKVWDAHRYVVRPSGSRAERGEGSGGAGSPPKETAAWAN